MTRFLYDGADMIAEYNASNVLLRRYVFGPGVDEPLVWYEGAGTSDRRWLIADERGSIVAVTNAAGTATSINSYDEYGTPGVVNAGRFQYTGQMWLGEAGVYHFKARAYAPSLGRFLQADPIGYAGGLNLYAYVANDPVNFTDPWGLDKACRADGVIVDCDTIVVTGEPNRCDPECQGERRRRREIEFQLREFREQEEEFMAGRCLGPCGFEREEEILQERADTALGIYAAILPIPKIGWAGRLFGQFSRAVLSVRFIIPGYKASQVAARGWSGGLVAQTIRSPTLVGQTVNARTGNAATAYFRSSNQYVVIDDVTREVVQISDLARPGWIVDSRIVNITRP